MPAPKVPGVVFTDNMIYRGKSKGKQSSKASTGYILQGGDINNGHGIDYCREDIQKQGYWVIIHGHDGLICWTGKITSISDTWQWYFTVYNTSNELDVQPPQGESTVTVTVVNPVTGPSNPAPALTNVVQVD